MITTAEKRAARLAKHREQLLRMLREERDKPRLIIKRKGKEAK